MNGRRALLSALLVVGAQWLAPAHAQSPNRIYRLGVLAPTVESVRLTRDLTLPELATLGFVDGRNLVVDARIGAPSELPGLVREMLAAKPDAIIAIGGSAVRSARAATSSVAIVMFADEPVGQGWAESFARPGGNVTGIANMVVELHEKRLELLLEAVPAARRVAVLLKSNSTNQAAYQRAIQVVATSTGVEVKLFTADGPSDYPAAFAAMRAAGTQALVIGADPEFARDGALLAALALEAGQPTSCEWAWMAQAGCLLGYGPDRGALRRRMAHQVAGIFRGGDPATIPIERPTIFEFAVNLKTARTLGIAIPSSILLRADEVIE